MSSVLKGKTILVIDDEPTMLDIVREILNRSGATPIMANTQEKAVFEITHAKRLDAVILDRYMPDGDGLEFLKKLKVTPETKTLPVIMLTGEKDMAEVKKTLQHGAVGYIGKPFTPKAFLTQIEKILDRRVQIDF